jgi:hypothetical protein
VRCVGREVDDAAGDRGEVIADLGQRPGADGRVAMKELFDIRHDVVDRLEMDGAAAWGHVLATL